MSSRILIIDYGSQYTQLIARRVREARVYSEIHPPTRSLDWVRDWNPTGIILSGGPNSVYDEGAPGAAEGLLEVAPVLGVCYGMNLLAHMSGGRIQPASHREYGRAEIEVVRGDGLFAGFGGGERTPVWMSHGDQVVELPDEFVVTARSANSPIAAFRHRERPLFGVQFHPEVAHTPRGGELLENFLFTVCKATPAWTPGAFIDDETLPRGRYFLRARVADAAGLEQSSDRWEDGNPAALKLPIRVGTRLVAGRPGRRHCRRSGPHRRRVCRRLLASRPKLRVGRSARLFGRLTLNRKAMAGVAVEVWRQLEGAGDWKRIGTATTSRTGRFSYKARRGPARTIRFRYPGTALIRGRNADVRLRVRASTSLGVNHRSVVTGNYVRFRGHLRGGWLPAGGVLVELQVRTRGKWRTFAQPRASGTNGRWSYQYRFETIRGRASFRFRARIRRQRGYPFTTGHSRYLSVRVRGL